MRSMSANAERLEEEKEENQNPRNGERQVSKYPHLMISKDRCQGFGGAEH